MTDPNYAAGQVVNGRTICGAKKKDLNPCGAPPAKGGVRCGKHGGKSPQALKAAERRLAEQEATRNMEKAVRTLGITDKYQDVDPGKALLEEISRTWAHVQWLSGKVSELEGDDLVWGKTLHREGVGPEGPVDVSDHKAAPSIWYDLYLREREHLARVSAAALKAGIEARKIRLAEEQGSMVAAVLRQILDALNLSPTQWEMVPTIVPNALRQLTAAHDG